MREKSLKDLLEELKRLLCYLHVKSDRYISDCNLSYEVNDCLEYLDLIEEKIDVDS